MTENTSIQIRVDVSQGREAIKSLSTAVQGLSRSLRTLDSRSKGLDDLQRQAAGVTSSFSTLSKSISALSSAASRLGSINSNGFSNLERGATRAGVAISALGGHFGITTQAAGLLAAAVGGMSLAKFSSDVQNTGNALLSFKIGIDSVATSSKESGDALAYIRDAATRIGAPLDSATESFKQLWVNMRSLGRNPDEIKKVFSGFQTALTSLHVSSADQKLFWREVAETYSQGVIHTRQAILSAGSHLPGMAALLQQALGVNGEGLHSMFKSGGLPLETWTKAADILQQRYGSQLPEAFRHSQQNIVALQNSLTRLQQSVFENGFDSGFTTFLKTLQGGLNSMGIDDLGAKIGEAFRVGFTAASLFAQKVIELRDPITAVAKALAGYAIASTGIRLAAGAVALLMSPLGAAAALAALLSSQWDNLASVFSGSDASFNAGATAIKRLTGGWIDLQKAIKGAIELYELANGLFSGKSWSESKGLAATAGAQFDSGAYGREKGKDFGEGFTSTAVTIFGKLGATLKSALPSFDIGSFSKKWDKLYAQTAPRDFVGAGSYQDNAAHYAAQTNNDLTESLKKVWERLSPANKGLLEYKENLQAIAQMRGKLSPITGKPIGDSEISSLTQTAREKALTDAFPAASRIQSMMETVKLEQEALQNLGGNTSQVALENEREFLRFKLQMLKQHVDLTKQEEEAVRALIYAQSQLQKGGADGFTQWANSQKSAMDSLNGDIHSGLDSISNGIAKIVTEGKGKFKNLGEAIRSELHDILRGMASNLIKTGINSLMAQAIKSMSPQLNQLFGNSQIGGSIAKALGLGQGVLDKANGALDDAAKLASTNVAEMSVQAAVVNINGSVGGIGATGTDAFKPSTDIGKAVNPSAVGGILPKNDNGAALFSGNALQEFKANVRTGGLGSIPTNSASLFGAGLSGRQGLGDIGGALKAIPDFKLSSAESVAAFGKGLQKLTPFAERVGVTPISSLEAMYKRANLDKATESALRTVSPDMQAVMLRAQELSGTQIRANALMGRRTAEQQHSLYAQNRPGHWVTSKDGYNNPSLHQSGNAMDMTFADKNGRMRWGQPGEYENFNRYVQQAARERGVNVEWGGNWSKNKDWDHWQLTGKKAAGIDPTSTGSITKLTDSTKKLEEEARKAVQPIQGMTQPLQGMETSVTQLSSTMAQTGVQSVQSFEQQIQKLIEQMAAGLGGGGGGLGSLASEGASLIGGLFSEGGYSGNPVSSAAMPASFWAGAPAYAEGTPNTSGGMPAILHDNEAVVPLSRGRSIPVEINGAGGQTVINNNNHVTTNVQGVNDFHSFRRSQGQLMSAMQREVGRMAARNN